MSLALNAEQVKSASRNSLFSDKSWRWSPHSWSLPDEVCQWIEELSSAARSFYQGIDLLYRKSSRDESILRNEELLVPWVANYYDLGKPEWLIRHARSDAVLSLIHI